MLDQDMNNQEAMEATASEDESMGHVGIRGLYRINISDQDKAMIVGDSGWRKNIIPGAGIMSILMRSCTDITTPAGASGIQPIKFVWLGSASQATESLYYTEVNLSGYIDIDTTKISSTITAASAGASTSFSNLTFDTTFAAGWNSATETIEEVSLVDSDGGGSSWMYAASIFPSSSVTTSQVVNVTYNILMGNNGAS